MSAILNFAGLPVVEKEGMMRNAWFIRDAAGHILSCGVMGAGTLKTPGADMSTASKIECGSEAFETLTELGRQALRTSDGGKDA